MNSGPHAQYWRTWCCSWASSWPSTGRAETTTKPIVIATRSARSINRVSPLGARSNTTSPDRTDGRWKVRSPASRPISVFGDVQMNPSQTGTQSTVARSTPAILVPSWPTRSEEHTSELQSHVNLVCRLLLEKKKKNLKSLMLQQTQQKNKKT